jgi:hypothetical protein
MHGQNNVPQMQRPNRAIGFNFRYTAQLPYADAAKRFGFNNAVGGGFIYKSQTNYIFGVSGNFMFGNVIKEHAINFEGIVGKEGYFVNANGGIVQARLYERGYNVFLSAAKLFALHKLNRNSGVLAEFGAGYIQHKIRIEIPGEDVYQLQAAYKQGYDKLSSGLALKQFIGFQYMQQREHFVNYTIGLEVMEGFTRNRRGYNYDTRTPDVASRLDLFAGIRFTWFIPRYLAFRDGKDEYYFK